MDLISKPIFIGLAIIIFLMAGYIAYLSVVIATKETKLAQRDAMISSIETANHELKNSIVRHESEMANMRLQAQERAAQVERDKVKSSIIAKRHRTIASNVIKMKRTTNDECQDTIRLSKNYLKAKK
jgi:hypothetical protein